MGKIGIKKSWKSYSDRSMLQIYLRDFCPDYGVPIIPSVHITLSFSVVKFLLYNSDLHFHGYEQPQKITPKIKPHVSEANPRKFGDTKILQHRVSDKQYRP